MKKVFIAFVTVFLLAVVAFSVTACGGGTKEDPAASVTVSAAGKTEYVRNQPLDLSGVELTVTYESGKTSVFVATDTRVTVSAGDTLAAGTFSLTMTVEGQDATWTYTVRDPELKLVFGAGSYEEGKELTLSAAENHTDISAYVPTPDDLAMEFAGWFSDEDLTVPVSFNFGESVDTSADRTLYAGYDIDYSALFSYTVEENNEVTLNEFVYMGWADSALIIPKTVKLRPVTKIADGFMGFFASFFSYDAIIFAEGSRVREIGDNAFYGMIEVLSVTLPEGLQKIGENAFSGTGILSLTLPASLETLSAGAFEGCYSLKEVRFEENSLLKYLDDNVFAYCSALSEIVLPESVASIGSYAFSGCESLTRFEIGKNVRNIGVHAFLACSNLYEIAVSEDNGNYCSVDGNLYTKDQKTIVRYCFGKGEETFTFPEGVTSIYESAFDASRLQASLKTVVLPESLTYIGDYAFRNCSADFVLPKNLKTVADYAFTDYETAAFVLAEDNPYFTVKSGVLYSADGKNLIAVPTNYDSELFIFDTETERVLTGAFTNNKTIKYVVIPENSALQALEKDSLSVFTMKELCGLYIRKAEPFTIADGALHGTTVYNSNFAIYIGEELAPAYRTAWEEYSKEEGEDAFGIGDVIMTDDQVASEFLQRMQNLVGDFTTYEEFSELLGDFFANLEFFGMGNYYYFMADFTLLEGAYFSGVDFSSVEDYLKLYETTAVRHLVNFYDSLEIKSYAQEVPFYKVNAHYQALPENLRAELADVDAKITELLSVTDEIAAKQEEIIRRANDLVLATDDENFDRAAVEALLADYDIYGLTALSDFRWSDYLHICKLSCSLMIDDFLKMEINVDNLRQLRNLSRKHISASYDYALGIEDYLDNYFKAYSSREHLYRWRDYQAKYEEFISREADLIKEVVDRIMNYDLSAPFDIAYAQQTINLYDALEAEDHSYDDIEKRNAIALRFLICSFNALDLSVDADLALARELYENSLAFAESSWESCMVTAEEKAAFDAQVERLTALDETPETPEETPEFPEFPETEAARGARAIRSLHVA